MKRFLSTPIAFSVIFGASTFAQATTVTFTPMDDITISTSTDGGGQNGRLLDRRFMGVSDDGDVIAVNDDTREVIIWNGEVTHNLGSKDCDRGATGKPVHRLYISRDASNILFNCTDNGSHRRLVKNGDNYENAGTGVTNYRQYGWKGSFDWHNKDFNIASKDGNVFRIEKSWQNDEAVAVLSENGNNYNAVVFQDPELEKAAVKAMSPNGRYVLVSKPRPGVAYSYISYIVDLTDLSFEEVDTSGVHYNAVLFVSNNGEFINRTNGIQDTSADGSTSIEYDVNYYGNMIFNNPYIYTEWNDTRRPLEDFISAYSGNLQGWTDLKAVAMSQNGLYIVGTGTNADGETDKGFVVEIDPVAECTYGY